ncbi:unnamed protein product [Aphanomyces euteiches]
MKIVICGGGVVGCSLAYFLTHSSAFGEADEVIIIEETDVAAAASGKAGGFLAADWCQGEDVDELCRLSFRLHQELASKLDGEKAYDYRRVDTISCLVSTKANAKHTRNNDNVVPAWIIAPVVKTDSIGSTATNAQVHPRKFTQTMLDQAVATGKARLLRGAVQGVLDAPTRGVVVDGETISADAIVLAMGPWTFPALTKWVQYPSIAPRQTHKIHSVVLRTEATPSIDPVVIFGDIKETNGDVEIVPRPDGSIYACGPRATEPLPANASLVQPKTSHISKLVADVGVFGQSSFDENAIEAAQACYLPATKDNIPIIGRVRDGLYVAAGHGCWGILNAPGTALAMSEVEKNLIDRKRNVLVLMLHYCVETGYLQTAEKLQQEAGVALSKFEVVDNIDLLRIVQEFEDFYEMKFGKKPKLVRRTSGDEEKAKASQFNEKKIAMDKRNKRNSYTSPNMPTEARVENNAALKAQGVPEDIASLEPTVVPVSGQKAATRAPTKAKKGAEAKPEEDHEESVEERLLKPLPFMHDSELRPLAETITREIFQKNPNVHWDNVVGLTDAKRLLKEAVVMPSKYPQLFKGLLSPWCGILLYGPPGNGKTMLAKAVATECKTTFFNISGSSIVSKYRGDSEKLVRMLFDLARYHAPSTIFLDEIDSIMGQRGDNGGGGQEHEASRRMKTELLIQMDGLAKTNEVVFVLAASNLPWELDSAMLRRLEKRVLVGLPSTEARLKMFAELLAPYISSDLDLTECVAKTDGYSGADIKLVAKEACMAPVRRLMTRLEAPDADSNQLTCDSGNWHDLLDKITNEDLVRALEKTKPSAHQFLRKYETWHNRFGSS